MSPNILAVVVYGCTAVAIACFFLALGNPNAANVPSFAALLGLLLAVSPLIFALAYARLVAEPSTGKTHTVLAAAVNGCMAAAVMYYFLFVRIPGTRMGDEPLAVAVAVAVVIPLLFLVASLAIFRNYTFRYALGTIAAAVVWPYWGWFELGAVHRIWDEPVSAGLLYASFSSPLIFVFAAGATVRNRRIGYTAGLVAGLAALAWFFWSEYWRSNFLLQNSWIAFNVPDRDDFGFILLSKFKILASGLIVVAIVTSALRLIPASWQLRKSPIRERTWPAFAACFVVLVVWFAFAVTPYRVPGAVDASRPEIIVLHVEKQGLQFHETTVSAWRDGQVWISRNDRRLLQYRIKQSGARGMIPADLEHRLLAMGESPEVRNVHTQSPKALRSWNAEGWYIVAPRAGVLAFTSEYGTTPPREIVDLFYEVERLPLQWTPQGDLKDVCLGFCYDPWAGLGSLYANQRCGTDNKGTRCG